MVAELALLERPRERAVIGDAGALATKSWITGMIAVP